jgi:hypothetical protein
LDAQVGAPHQDTIFGREGRRHHLARGGSWQFGVRLDQLDVEMRSGRADFDHRARLAAQVADLPRLRLAEEHDAVAIPDEPGGHDVRPAIGADRAQPQHRGAAQSGVGRSRHRSWPQPTG